MYIFSSGCSECEALSLPFGLLKQNITDKVAHKQYIFIFHSSGSWKSKLGCQQSRVRALFWVTDFSLYGRRTRDLCGLTFIRVLITSGRALNSWPNHSQGLCVLIPSLLGVRVSTYEFWGRHKHSDHGRHIGSSEEARFDCMI